MDLYKIVGPAGEPLNGGSGAWPLPTDTEPGAWRTIDGPLVACRNGLHLTDAEHLEMWLPSGGRFAVYRAETDGELIDAGGKWVAAKVRLLPRAVPMPDMTAAREKRDAAIRAATERRQRAEKRARKLLDADVPPVWQSYLANTGRSRLPAGHPGAVYQDKLRAARAAYDAAMAPAIRNAALAIGKAHAAYARAIADGLPS